MCRGAEQVTGSIGFVQVSTGSVYRDSDITGGGEVKLGSVKEKLSVTEGLSGFAWRQ